MDDEELPGVDVDLPPFEEDELPAEPEGEPSFRRGPRGISAMDLGAVADRITGGTPIWPRYHHLRGNGELYQVRLQRVEADGQAYDLGALEPDGTIEAMVARACNAAVMLGRPPEAAAATYRLIPVDSTGKKVDADPLTCKIPVDHPIILDYKQRAASGAPIMVGGTMAPAGMASQAHQEAVWDYLRKRDEAMAAERAANQSAVDGALKQQRENFEFLRTETSKLADERVQNLTAAKDSVLADQRKVFESGLEQEKRLHEREVSMIEAHNSREKVIAESAAKLQQDGFMFLTKMQENILAADRERAAQREKERDAERERERAAAAADREREREHNKAILALAQDRITQQSGLGGLAQLGQMKEVFGTLREIFDPEKDDEEGTATGEGPKTWMDRLFDMAEKGISAFTQAQAMRAQVEVAKSAEAVAAAGGVPMIPQVPQIQDSVMMGAGPAATPEGLAAAAQPNIQMAPPSIETSVIEQNDPANNLPIEVRKNARRILRLMIDNLRAEADRAQWGNIFVSAVMADPQTIDVYLRAVGARRALEDAGADPALIADAMKMLAESGRVPPEILR